MAIRGEKKMKRNMAEKLTASILAAVLTFGMMAQQQRARLKKMFRNL